MTIHELKCAPPHCARIARGEKTFEIRLDDRGYKTGDLLHLEEWDPVAKAHTGRHVVAYATHIVRAAEFPDALQPGYVVMSLELYRTWVDGQAGPGDWSEDVPSPVMMDADDDHPETPPAAPPG